MSECLKCHYYHSECEWGYDYCGYKDIELEVLDGCDNFRSNYSEINKQLETRLKDAESVIDMVYDNRKMPHQHKDYYERLCCLSERANEYRQKYKLSTNESSQ